VSVSDGEEKPIAQGMTLRKKLADWSDHETDKKQQDFTRLRFFTVTDTVTNH
jgi:hypothetical protein